MEGIQFDSEKDLERPHPRASVASGITNWLVQNKFAKDEKGASMILVGVLVLCLIGIALNMGTAFRGTGTLDAVERAKLERSTAMPR